MAYQKRSMPMQHREKPKTDPRLLLKATEAVEDIFKSREVQGRFARYKQKNISWRTEKDAVIRHLQKSDKLCSTVTANPNSLILAMLEAANLGLTLYPTMGFAYLGQEVLHKNSEKETPVVTLIVGYRGLEHLALRSKTVKNIATELVCEKDSFRRGMTRDGATWVEWEAFTGPDRGKVIGGFTRAILANGTNHIEWMDAKELAGCEAAAKRGDSTPPSWSGAFRGEMQKKCIVRRAAKHWDLTEPMQEALKLLDNIEPEMNFDQATTSAEIPCIDKLSESHRKSIIEKVSAKGFDEKKVDGWIGAQINAWGHASEDTFADTEWEKLLNALLARADNIIEQRKQREASHAKS